MTPSTDLKDRVKRILLEEIAPALDLDGAALEVLDVADGGVQVRLGGVCGGCPSTLMTVIHGMEQELRRRIPEIKYLEALQ
jgi:Fe-S cluster biogenesis protein NfuA